MKKLLLSLCIFLLLMVALMTNPGQLFITTTYAQTYNLTVNNGYGSGTYHSGDTVHVWSVAYDSTKTFSKWIGNTSSLNSSKEWHSSLIMPNQNISITAVIANMPSYTIHYEQIMGKNNLKNVFYSFPVNLKGIIYLFHGTSGNASNWINTVEYRSFVNAAIADSLGIIVTEAEEITLNTDLNGDGKLRWQGFPLDTIAGIDYLNIKILTDTFIHRGLINTSTPKFSVGMSNGGSYSAASSYINHFKAGVSYCASSVQAIFGIRTSPFAFRMAQYDDNTEVGPTGNYEAWQNDSMLAFRGICHDYKINDKQPIYPERFARISGVSTTASQAMYNDLINHNLINSHHYALHSDTIKNSILAHPSWFPNIISFPVPILLEALNQISAANAEHKFYSDYNAATLDFIKNLCSPDVSINDFQTTEQNLSIYPNPSSNLINIDLAAGNYTLRISNQIGQTVYSVSNINGLSTIDISSLDSGIYFIHASNEQNSWSTKLVKE